MSFSNPEVFKYVTPSPNSLKVKNSGGKEVMRFLYGDQTELAWVSKRNQGSFRKFTLDLLGVERPTGQHVRPDLLVVKYDWLSVLWSSYIDNPLPYNEIALRFSGAIDKRAVSLAREFLAHTLAPGVDSEINRFTAEGIYAKFLQDNPGYIFEAMAPPSSSAEIA